MSETVQSVIRVMVVDDHPVVLEGLKAVFSTVPDIEVVGSAMSGADAISLAAAYQPAVVLLDMEMPPPTGSDLIRALAEVCSARVLMMTVLDDDDLLVDCMKAGAAGYLLKGTPLAEVVASIRLAFAGEVSLSPSLTRRLLARMSSTDAATEERRELLSPRELEVLTLVMNGFTNRAIAARLYVSERTVKAHLTAVFAKLGVDDRTAAVSAAIRLGLIDVGMKAPRSGTDQS